MEIGKVIRKYRKEQNLTQEELALRLGVTTPAVNKWENNVSYPDITLLAPLARSLHISVDTLLSFQDELTEKEIHELIKQADTRIKTESYDEVFQWAQSIIETNPNCLQLLFQLTSFLDAHRLLKNITLSDKQENLILHSYERVLDSKEEKLRTAAADSLFAYYYRNENYDKAETLLNCFSEQNPERKRKQASLYSQTGQMKEAKKTYEELLFSGYQTMSMVFHNLYMLALKEDNMSKAHMLAKKQEELARLFEMGKYHEASSFLELATLEKNDEKIVDIMETMLQNLEDINGFRHSALYEHMSFNDVSSEFTEELRQNLLECFRDEETYGFLKENEKWKKIVD